MVLGVSPHCLASSAAAHSRHLGDVAVVLTNAQAVFPFVVLLTRGYLGAAMLVGLGGVISMVYHACNLRPGPCFGIDKGSFDSLDFLSAGNLAVVVAFILNDGEGTRGHRAYRAWRLVREPVAVVCVLGFVAASLGAAHRKTMPLLAGAVSVPLLLVFFPRHVARDPALKAHYTRLAWWMVGAALLLVASLSLLHVRGAWFRSTHALWHFNVFTFIGLVGLLVPTQRAVARVARVA